MERLAFSLYLIFITSWFLHLTARYPFLGSIRFDLLLIILIFTIFILFIDKSKLKGLQNPCYKKMLLLIAVILAISPFAEWPGSVINFGLVHYVKAIVFFFCTVWLVQSESRVKILILVFVLCQSFRVMEPLYLHITDGYWGSIASMAGWQDMNRLSGAPFDVINPNGLAFVVLTIIPFILALYKENLLWRMIAVTVGPASLYVLYLTGSRSGMLGLLTILIVYIVKSEKKILKSLFLTIVVLYAVSNMEGDFKDRYLSIFTSSASNSASAEGRIQGVIRDFKVGMRKPILGHGIGTSAEANANYGEIAQISHNIYTETFQEIGIVGLIVFIIFIFSILENLNRSDIKGDDTYFFKLRYALFIFFGLNIVFGLASYGLSSYEWYLLGGLSIIVNESQGSIQL